MARDKTLHADPLPRDKGKDGRSLTSNVTPTPFNTSTATPTPKLPRPAPLLLVVVNKRSTSHRSFSPNGKRSPALLCGTDHMLCGMLLVVVFRFMNHIGKAASCHTLTTRIYNSTKKNKTTKLLQNNYIHLLGNIQYYFSL